MPKQVPGRAQEGLTLCGRHLYIPDVFAKQIVRKTCCCFSVTLRFVLLRLLVTYTIMLLEPSRQSRHNPLTLMLVMVVSLFVWCLMFVVCCLLFVVCCLLFVVVCLFSCLVVFFNLWLLWLLRMLLWLFVWLFGGVCLLVVDVLVIVVLVVCC